MRKSSQAYENCENWGVVNQELNLIYRLYLSPFLSS